MQKAGAQMYKDAKDKNGEENGKKEK